MTGNDPTTFERLLDWTERQLTDAEMRKVEEQLSAAQLETQATIDWLRAFNQARSRVQIEAPPENLHAALLAQFQPALAQQILRRVSALLTFDSADQPALAGLRSLQTRARQVIYDCALMEIAINVRPSRRSDLLDINGQVFPRALATASELVVHLSRGDLLADIALTNEFGEFSFTALSPGVHTLTLIAGDSQVEIEAIEVQLDAHR
jgi:hypothetical protein